MDKIKLLNSIVKISDDTKENDSCGFFILHQNIEEPGLHGYRIFFHKNENDEFFCKSSNHSIDMKIVDVEIHHSDLCLDIKVDGEDKCVEVVLMKNIGKDIFNFEIKDKALSDINSIVYSISDVNTGLMSPLKFYVDIVTKSNMSSTVREKIREINYDIISSEFQLLGNEAYLSLTETSKVYPEQRTIAYPILIPTKISECLGK